MWTRLWTVPHAHEITLTTVITSKPKESKMAKGKTTQTTSKEVNQHKRLAMGEHVTGMKKGGAVKSKKEHKKKK